MSNKVLIERVNKSDITVLIILKLLRRLDNCFIPPISSQVDLSDYARKITDYAEIFFAKTKSGIVGMSALYCNDFESYTAFITSIGLLQEYQGQGIGKKLLDASIDLANSKGMAKIDLKVSADNIQAINFYKNNGFVTDGTRNKLTKVNENNSSYLKMTQSLSK